MLLIDSFGFVIVDRQRTGLCLEDLNFEELYNLEQEMENAARLIRERKVTYTMEFLGTAS